MKEQKVNERMKKIQRSLTEKVKLVAASFLLLLLAACMPSGDQKINTELFKDKQDMAERTAALKSGMSKKKVFETLNIDPERFDKMGTVEVQMAIYGNAQVQGTPAQLEKFRKKLQSYDGYSLPFRELKSSSSIGFGKMKIQKKGYDLRMVLIFEKNKLIKAEVDGTHKVKTNEDRYMWEGLIRRSIGFAL